MVNSNTNTNSIESSSYYDKLNENQIIYSFLELHSIIESLNIINDFKNQNSRDDKYIEFIRAASTILKIYNQNLKFGINSKNTFDNINLNDDISIIVKGFIDLSVSENKFLIKGVVNNGYVSQNDILLLYKNEISLPIKIKIIQIYRDIGSEEQWKNYKDKETKIDASSGDKIILLVDIDFHSQIQDDRYVDDFKQKLINNSKDAFILNKIDKYNIYRPTHDNFNDGIRWDNFNRIKKYLEQNKHSKQFKYYIENIKKHFKSLFFNIFYFPKFFDNNSYIGHINLDIGKIDKLDAYLNEHYKKYKQKIEEIKYKIENFQLSQTAIGKSNQIDEYRNLKMKKQQMENNMENERNEFNEKLKPGNPISDFIKNKFLIKDRDMNHNIEILFERFKEKLNGQFNEAYVYLNRDDSKLFRNFKFHLTTLRREYIIDLFNKIKEKINIPENEREEKINILVNAYHEICIGYDENIYTLYESNVKKHYDKLEKNFNEGLEFSIEKMRDLFDFSILDQNRFKILIIDDKSNSSTRGMKELLDSYHNLYKNAYDYSKMDSRGDVYKIETISISIKILELDLLYLVYSHKTVLLFFNMLQNKLFSVGYKSKEEIYMTEALIDEVTKQEKNNEFVSKYRKKIKKNDKKSLYKKYKNELNKLFMKLVLEKRSEEKFSKIKDKEQRAKKHISSILSILPASSTTKNNLDYFKKIEYLRTKYMVANEDTIFRIQNAYDIEYHDIEDVAIPISGRLTIKKLKDIFIKPLEDILNRYCETVLDEYTGKEIKTHKIDLQVISIIDFVEDSKSENDPINLFPTIHLEDDDMLYPGNYQTEKYYYYYLLSQLRRVLNDKVDYDESIKEYPVKKQIFYDLEDQSLKNRLYSP